MHFIFLVPSPVKDINISAKTNSLLISWSHGSGNVESYQLMLMDKDILVHGSVVDKHATSYSFHRLTPGHLYNLTIVTKAAGLQNYRWKPARTSKFHQNQLKKNKAHIKEMFNNHGLLNYLNNGNRRQIEIHILQKALKMHPLFYSEKEGLPCILNFRLA